MPLFNLDNLLKKQNKKWKTHWKLLWQKQSFGCYGTNTNEVEGIFPFLHDENWNRMQQPRNTGKTTKKNVNFTLLQDKISIRFCFVQFQYIVEYLSCIALKFIYFFFDIFMDLHQLCDYIQWALVIHCRHWSSMHKNKKQNSSRKPMTSN